MQEELEGRLAQRSSELRSRYGHLLEIKVNRHRAIAPLRGSVEHQKKLPLVRQAPSRRRRQQGVALIRALQFCVSMPNLKLNKDAEFSYFHTKRI